MSNRMIRFVTWFRHTHTHHTLKGIYQ